MTVIKRFTIANFDIFTSLLKLLIGFNFLIFHVRFSNLPAFNLYFKLHDYAQLVKIFFKKLKNKESFAVVYEFSTSWCLQQHRKYTSLTYIQEIID